MIKLRNLLRKLGALGGDRSGISIVEFALVLPVLLTLGLFGVEIARLATSKMKVSQIALSVADNASRLGQTDNSGVQPTVTETDVDAILAAALRQGQDIGLEANGRIILSSLEYDDITDKQYIHWQRCSGDKDVDSNYGNDTTENGLVGSPITGMGRGTQKATATSGEAVMFVEIYFTYDSLFLQPFGSGSVEITEEAGFLIRDDRNLTPGITGLSSSSPCS